jgi:cytochrome P450
VVLLLTAGQDTTAAALTKVVANLQDHPEVLQRLRGEQAAVVAKHGAAITPGALKDMQYTEAVIRCVRACAFVRVRACVRACVRVCVCVSDTHGLWRPHVAVLAARPARVARCCACT